MFSLPQEKKIEKKGRHLLWMITSNFCSQNLKHFQYLIKNVELFKKLPRNQLLKMNIMFNSQIKLNADIITYVGT